MSHQMNSRDLVIQTINHKATWKIPKGELVLADEIIQNRLKRETVGFRERLEFVNQLGLDLITLSPKYSLEKDFTLDFKHLELPKWTKDTSLFTFVILDGAFEYGLRTFGFQDFFTMIAKDTKNIREFITRVESLNIDAIHKLADLGVNGVILADDIAYQNGLMLNPKQFRELFLPSFAKQVEVIKNRQMIPFFHSDGNYLAIIDDIVDIGFKGIHCMDKKCGITLDTLKPYKDKLCLWGHLDSDDLNDSKDETVMNRLLGEMGNITDSRGFILGTNSGLFTGMNIPRLQDIYANTENLSRINRH